MQCTLWNACIKGLTHSDACIFYAGVEEMLDLLMCWHHERKWLH